MYVGKVEAKGMRNNCLVCIERDGRVICTLDILNSQVHVALNNSSLYLLFVPIQRVVLTVPFIYLLIFNFFF